MVRLKTRYLVVEVTPASASARKPLTLQRDDVAGLIRESIARNYGDYGVGLLQYAFHVLYFSPHTRFAVVRCAREQCKLVESSLAFVTESQNQELRVRVARVCGSGRTCRAHLLAFSLERAEAQHLASAYVDFPKELEDEIAAIEAQ
ncbi:hypothetical protein PybrP1_012454 [[Pythium] brassicae (nom. inval.)]|nr:hypothetical protein PybrP1_012454 [[Pythium] brassicae (nom. inval.)]